MIEGWAKATLSPKGPLLWQTLLHKSACLSCAWGTGGQNGGFRDELGEPLQRCLKSVEAIGAELQPAVPESVFSGRSLGELQRLSSLEADRLGRLSHPLILREGRSHYERLAWDDVFAIAEAAFRVPPERVASYSSGRSSNEAAYLLQLLLRAWGSNNLADCSDLCHAPSTVGLSEVFGSGTSMVSLESLQQADCVVLVGSNAPANHPRLMNELIRLRERGGSVIVINPVLEVGLLKFGSPAFPIKSMLRGSEIASLFLQPVPGSDTAVFLGIQKALLEAGQIRQGVPRGPHRRRRGGAGAAARHQLGGDQRLLRPQPRGAGACRRRDRPLQRGGVRLGDGDHPPRQRHRQRPCHRQHRPAQRQRGPPRSGHDADPRPLQRAGLRLHGRDGEAARRDAEGPRGAAGPPAQPCARLRHQSPDPGGRRWGRGHPALPGGQPLGRQP